MGGFHRKVITIILFVLIILLILVGYSTTKLVRNGMESDLQSRIEQNGKVIEKLMKEENDLTVGITNRINLLAESMGIEVILYTEQGKSLYRTLGGNSFNDTNLKAIQHFPKVTGHFMSGNNDDAFYITPIMTDLHLVIIYPYTSVINVEYQIWFALFACFGLAFILLLVFGNRIISQYTSPIEAATRVAFELAKGNYRARTYEDRLTETGMLSKSINILARNLQEMTAQREMEQDRLRTLIENMGSGLILLDEKGYIHLVNKAYLELFDTNEKEYIHKLYYEAFPHKKVTQLVEEIFFTERKLRKQLQLTLKIERKHFEVFGSPIIGINEEWKGTVLVFHDITELKKLEEMRKDFVANVSHELKTPMTSIKGFSETLLEGAMEDEEIRVRFLNIILKESQRLQNLINDLLDLSHIEEDGFKLNIHQVDVKEVLSDVVVMLKSKAEDKNINLQLITKNDLTFIDGDSYRLKQVFINLINNAISYTLPKGNVFIYITTEENTVSIDVMDTGIGMDIKEVPRIFERFYRIDKARSRTSGGTGLGLAIVKHIIDAHHGRILVKSEKEKGTTFTVVLKKVWDE